jgi:cytosine/adenosine deaminase-related metal-dependent hydrolase
MLNEQQIGDIWVFFSEYIDKKQLEAAAERYIDLLADFGVTDRIMQAATGVEPTLDQAIEYYLDEEDDEDEDYDELEF